MLCNRKHYKHKHKRKHDFGKKYFSDDFLIILLTPSIRTQLSYMGPCRTQSSTRALRKLKSKTANRNANYRSDYLRKHDQKCKSSIGFPQAIFVDNFDQHAHGDGGVEMGAADRPKNLYQRKKRQPNGHRRLAGRTTPVDRED